MTPTDRKPEETRVTRYDLITNYRAGSSIEEMEPSDDGEWVRYEDVEKLVAAMTPADVKALIEKWREWAHNAKARSLFRTDAYAEAVLTCADDLSALLQAPAREGEPQT